MAETQKNQGAVVLVSASSIGCADWASTQPAGIESIKCGYDVIRIA
ncbi:hypothetical protein [Synechococcus sp. PROS-9-1]|nr:hypothetical protein [Synechococcus sp. PROS-9-1]